MLNPASSLHQRTCPKQDPDFENGTVSSSSDSPAVVNGDSSAAATSSGPLKGKHHVPNGVAVPNGLIRRSNRRQKVRGEKEIIVSSDMLLRDLKVKVGSLIVICPGVALFTRK